MAFQEFITALPSKTLEPYIYFYFQHRFKDNSQSSNSQHKQTTLPTGCNFLNFNFSKPIEFDICSQVSKSIGHKVYLSGQFDNLYSFNLTKNANLFGVVLRPTAAYRLVKLPMNEIRNSTIEADYHICKNLRELYEKMADIPFTNRIEQFEKWMLTKVVQDKTDIVFTDWAVKKIIRQKGMITTNYLAKELKVSERHLQRSFKERIGMRPLKYASIVKINNLVNNLNQTNDRLIDLLYDYQYHDKSHFRKQFKLLTHNTLSSYLATQNEAAQTFLNRLTF